MIPNNLDEIILGQDALEYITESLRDGEELSAMVLKTIALEAGNVVTYLPIGTASSSIKQFRSGGILGSPSGATATAVDQHKAPARFSAIPNLDNSLISIVTDHLKSTPSALCLFENRLAKPADPWLRHSKLHNVTLGTSVCHYLTSNDSFDAELVRLTINKSRSIRPPLLGVLAKLSGGGATSQIGDVVGNDLKAIVGRMEKLVVGAYDGEGFILWRSSH
jgi:hypothetical protein